MEARPSDPWVAAERIRLLYGQTVLLLTANLINGALVLVALWDRVDWRIPLGWGLALVAVAAGRVLLWRGFRRAEPDNDKIGRWGSAFTMGSTLSGMVWGSAPLLFLQPGDHLALTLLAFVIGGTTAGALIESLGYVNFYLLTTLLALPGMRAWEAAGLLETERDVAHDEEVLASGELIADLRAPPART